MISGQTRCAIYARKSADEAHDSQLGSTTVQRQLCEAYILSQSGEGWICLPEAYEDVGWSGGTLKRPALARLRQDVAAGKIDAVIVYKIDRLSRSLKDFLGLVDELDLAGATFVSVTQSFNTTNSMGRLMLNVLLSFAQFERELTSERLSDWYASARSRGIWCSPRPFGYKRGQDGRLVVVPEEAEIIREAFDLYCRLGSSRLVANALNLKGYRNKLGNRWGGHCVVIMIKNRLYLGQICHRGIPVPDAPRHEAIIAEHVWDQAQAQMEASRQCRKAMARDPDEGLLRGRIQHHLGKALIHVTAQGRNRQTYRYYVPKVERYGSAKPQHRFRAADLEAAVVSALSAVIGKDLKSASHSAQLRVIRDWVETVTVHDAHMTIKLYSGGEISGPHAGGLRVRYDWPKRQPPPWLPEAQRMVADGLSISETARRLGQALGSVHRVIRRYETGES